MKKYFIIDDLKTALLIKGMLNNVDFKTFHDSDKDRYSFVYVEGIEKMYGMAKTIIENL